VTIAYFDCIAGVSGDMILGALLDAGLAEQTLQERLSALHLDDFHLHTKRVVKNAFSATKVDVHVHDDVPERHLAEIESIVTTSDLCPEVVERAVAIFRRLSEAEAAIHDASLDAVHLHELGGVDTIVDVVGALVGLDALGVERVVASPVPLGRGFIHGTHGQIPLPAPATVALLKGAPVVGSPVEAETVTPTGAVLLTSLADAFGPIPPMRLEAVGYGAGGRDLPIPNLLRVFLGQGRASGGDPTIETLLMLETNIDDMNPEFYEHTMARLFEAGALDVFTAPIQMKKNRPATRLHVLCRPDRSEALRQVLYAETTTLGVRQQTLRRHALRREKVSVQTPYGEIDVKVALLGGGETKAAPEYEACRRQAQAHGVPLRTVYQAAVKAAGERDEHHHHAHPHPH